MRREIPTWLAVLIIVVVLVVIIGAYVWLTSPKRTEGGMVTKPPVTVAPGEVKKQGQTPQAPAEAH